MSRCLELQPAVIQHLARQPLVSVNLKVDLTGQDLYIALLGAIVLDDNTPEKKTTLP